MTQSITEIKIEDLKADLAETEADIALCELAIREGVLMYNGKSTQDRLDTNYKIRSMIKREIARRQAKPKRKRHGKQPSTD